jgi:hypothetical protein
VRRVAHSLGLSIALWGISAAAQVPGLTLEWQAPAGCPSQAQLEKAVLSGRLDREAAPGRQVSAKVLVEQRADGTFRAVLTTRAPEGGGTRELEGESCDAIASASAVVLALALDPPTEPVPPPPTPVEPEPVRVDRAPRRPLAWRGYAHAFGGGVLRALPEPAPWFGLGIGAQRGVWDVELLASLAPSQSAALSTPAGASASISLVGAQALGCYAPVLSDSTALEVCAGLLFERLSGESKGISNPADNSIALFSPELGLRSRVRVSDRFELGLGVTGTARPEQARFVVGGVGQVHEMPVFDGMLDAGLRAYF